VIATEWPEFAGVELAGPLRTMQRRLIVDANRFLARAIAELGGHPELGGLSALEYYAVGVPTHG
jgi:hypothetical protein